MTFNFAYFGVIYGIAPKSGALNENCAIIRKNGAFIYMKNQSELASKQCIPCTKGTPSLKGEQLVELHKQLGSGWAVIDEHHLEKEYTFRNFLEALAFTNKIGTLAEQEGHHPDIYLSYGKVKIILWTHKVGGLSESDFILAAKCEKSYG